MLMPNWVFGSRKAAQPGHGKIDARSMFLSGSAFDVHYSQYYGDQGHIKDGHTLLHSEYIMAPTTVLIQKCASFGLPKILTVAHVLS